MDSLDGHRSAILAARATPAKAHLPHEGAAETTAGREKPAVMAERHEVEASTRRSRQHDGNAGKKRGLACRVTLCSIRSRARRYC